MASQRISKFERFYAVVDSMDAHRDDLVSKYDSTVASLQDTDLARGLELERVTRGLYASQREKRERDQTISALRKKM
jgi:hypothetical protein